MGRIGGAIGCLHGHRVFQSVDVDAQALSIGL
jgi:hypothetical protein